MSRFRSLRFRFAALCLLAVLVTTATLLTVMHTQVRQLVEDTTSVLIQSAESETAKVTRDVYTMCQVVHEGLLNQVDTNLRVERHQLEQLGGVSFDRAEVAWTALEQGTRAEVALRLPKMMIGGKWLGQNSEPTVPTPWVDEVQKALGGTVTVFQRMNERGDMLRVATTVVDSGGKRAIGTYLAAQGTDGEANPVIAAILSGNSYRGRAFVVNDWYITGYEPLLDSANRVIGMLYAGVKQEIPLRSGRKAITSIVVGKTGYVWAVGGKGDKKGHYFVSLNGARDGEDVHEMKDAEGNLVIQQLIAQGLATRNGSINYQRYQWLNPGEKAPRQKLAAVTYVEPWDWVIGAGTYEDDFTTTLQRVTDVVASITRWSLVSALMILLAVVAAMMIVLRRLAKPLDQLVHASEAVASGDLTQSLDV
ncbi:MAG: Cache 3/Cache 2 fusion domain-containing protein, partial [Deltaproteobacteria bacterium]|nr:Cache 3/Cache 2 fusion domain-containing protein [Deltaproteobacteria bacterium]